MYSRYQSYEQPRPKPPHCKRCGSRIAWVQAMKKHGSGYARGGRIPCEPQLEYGDGEKTLVTHDGIVVPKAPRHVLGREPHFGNCKARQAAQQPTPDDASTDDVLEQVLTMVKLPK